MHKTARTSCQTDSRPIEDSWSYFLDVPDCKRFAPLPKYNHKLACVSLSSMFNIATCFQTGSFCKGTSNHVAPGFGAFVRYLRSWPQSGLVFARMSDFAFSTPSAFRAPVTTTPSPISASCTLWFEIASLKSTCSSRPVRSWRATDALLSVTNVPQKVDSEA